MTRPVRRPQRQLTEAELEDVRGVQTLNLHRMLHLGLVDPVPNPSPMTEDEGARVREHVWPAFFHRIDDGYAFGFWRWALCERGTCWNCLAGRCEWCMHRQKGRPDACDNAEPVHNQHGRTVATLIPRPGGEPCVWWCRCPCPKDDARPPTGPALTVATPRQSGSLTLGSGSGPDGQDPLPGL
ncbi:DUF6248 family natural product biosynthesis protein [Streptomyces sp. NBC_01142]|uniref:DUF6248 family natural product biosynthesis protein n=1 Tax=Streptomyces sp. NBC_01142 TaxID=2975865 RepID=UPI00224CFB14|nr:DUF6248 family natural product biosynthesis protein [Streptomyces sp. NBC_01142]MCX4826776.1 DUF6248 family natural product biosynthesis protein [Streptomyces sp. NBC_01142]